MRAREKGRNTKGLRKLWGVLAMPIPNCSHGPTGVHTEEVSLGKVQPLLI